MCLTIYVTNNNTCIFIGYNSKINVQDINSCNTELSDKINKDTMFNTNNYAIIETEALDSIKTDKKRKKRTYKSIFSKFSKF